MPSSATEKPPAASPFPSPPPPLARGADANAPDEPAPKAGGPARRILGIIVVLGLAIWLGHFAYDLFCYEETDDAFVAGHVHQVSPQMDGTVQAVLARDNQLVTAGEVLVRLDPLEFDLGVRRAEADLGQARAELARAVAAGAQARAQLAETAARRAQAVAQAAQARAQFELARINRDRARKLFGEGGADTQSDVDTAESAFAAAQAALDAGGANVKAEEAGQISAQASQQAADAQQAAAQASLAAREAAVADAKRKLSYATLTAPADGRIGNKAVEVGNRVQAGQTLFALVEPRAWIVANFKETQLGRLHAGLPVEVTVDALPGRKLYGVIDSIAPASGAQFALLPADNATGNFTKVVQRVPVKIALDPGSLKGIEDRIRPGLSAIVRIRVR